MKATVLMKVTVLPLAGLVLLAAGCQSTDGTANNGNPPNSNVMYQPNATPTPTPAWPPPSPDTINNAPPANVPPP